MDGWKDLGAVDALKSREVQPIDLDGQPLALICSDGVFSALPGRCLHAGGPLGEGQLNGDYVVCPWHDWKFHRLTGEGEPGFEAIASRATSSKVEDGRLWVEPRRSHAIARKPHASRTR